eukprot:scaffold25659_cov59-Phaeocystis_antarctica.AAC.5
MLTEARGSLRHALALRAASGAPAGRRLSPLDFDTGGCWLRPASIAPSSCGTAAPAQTLTLTPTLTLALALALALALPPLPSP